MNAARIVYLAAGSGDDLHTQAHYAVLSALAWAPEAAVHVFTDQPQRYANIAQHVRLEPLPPAPPDADPFRLKLEVVRHAAERFPEDVILFCDVDTFFLRDAQPLLARLRHGDHLLHRMEYELERQPTAQMRRFRRALQRAGVVCDGAAMWNSGMIGLPAGSAGLVEQALQTLAQLAPQTPKKYLAEQFAISLALQRTASLAPAEAFVFHYWYQKQDYTRAIRSRLSVWSGFSIEEAADALRRLPLALPAPPQKLHWWERVLIAAKLREPPVDPRGL
jgi:hypothetical protein